MMAKKAIAKLIQSPRDNSRIVDLNPDEVAMITGVMGGCCSVVLLWGQYIDGTGYQHVRGQHAGGGPENFDWDSLLNDVPSGVGTQLVMSCAPSDYGSYILKIREALSERQFLCRRDFRKYCNAYVGRDSRSRDFDEAREASKFRIHNKGAPIVFV